MYCDLHPAKKRKSKALPIVLISLAIIFIGGITGAYFFLGKPDLVNDVPPSLELGGSKFQGQSIGEQLNSLVFDQTDIDSYQAPSGALFKTAAKGVNYYFAEKDIAVDEIIKNVKPQDKLNVLVAFYSPGESDLGTDKCYYIYPKGPYQETCEIKDPAKFTIPKNRGFALILSKEAEINSNVIKDSKTKAKSFTPVLKNNESGWMLLPLQAATNMNNNRAKSVWTLKSPNEFSKIADKSSPTLSGDYAMAWFNFDTASSTSVATTTATTTNKEVDTNIDTKEAEDQTSRSENVETEESKDVQTTETTEETTDAQEATKSIVPSLRLEPASEIDQERFLGFGNIKNPRSLVNIFSIQPEEDTKLIELKTTWEGCATPSNYNTVSKILAGGSDLVASDSNGDGDFSQNEFEDFVFKKDMGYMIDITGNTMNCESDVIMPSQLKVSLDYIKWEAGGNTYEKNYTDIDGDLIFDCEQGNNCKQEIGESFDIIANLIEGPTKVRIFTELANGMDIYGKGQNVNENQPLLLFMIRDESKDLFTNLEFKFSGCFSSDAKNPINVPKLNTENGFLANEPPIAEDSNKDGVFSESEFVNEKKGINPFVNYVIYMDTTNSCVFDIDNPDKGSIEFAEASPAHGNVNEIIFGL